MTSKGFSNAQNGMRWELVLQVQSDELLEMAPRQLLSKDHYPNHFQQSTGIPLYIGFLSATEPPN